jgi:hypothetical protein
MIISNGFGYDDLNRLTTVDYLAGSAGIELYFCLNGFCCGGVV